eukprot:GILJ01012601.1.p1 GENE.GILJ01012601.1~~GILJ01012601.1.p1  ORF type:complete len:1339 (+),score=295.11 GILJ01012601.1:71-4087(+)
MMADFPSLDCLNEDVVDIASPPRLSAPHRRTLSASINDGIFFPSSADAVPPCLDTRLHSAAVASSIDSTTSLSATHDEHSFTMALQRELRLKEEALYAMERSMKQQRLFALQRDVQCGQLTSQVEEQAKMLEGYKNELRRREELHRKETEGMRQRCAELDSQLQRKAEPPQITERLREELAAERQGKTQLLQALKDKQLQFEQAETSLEALQQMQYLSEESMQREEKLAQEIKVSRLENEKLKLANGKLTNTVATEQRAYQAVISQLRQENGELVSRATLSEERLTDCQAKLREMTAISDAQTAKLVSSAEVSDREGEALAVYAIEVSNRCHQVQQALDILADTCNRKDEELVRCLNDKSDLLRRLDETTEDLNRQLNVCHQENRVLERESYELKRQVNQAEQIKLDLEERVKDLSIRNEQLSSQGLQYQQQLQRLQQTVTSSESSHSEQLVDLRNRYESSEVQWRSDMNRLLTELRAQESKSTVLRNRLLECETDRESITLKLNNYKREVKVREMDLHELLEDSIQLLQSLQVESGSDLQQCTAKSNILQQRIYEVTELSQRYEQQYLDSKSELVLRNEQLRVIEILVQQQTVQLENLNSDLLRSTQESSHLKQELEIAKSSAESKMVKLKNELAEKTALLNKCPSESLLLELTKSNHILEERLNRVTTELDSTIATLQETKAQLNLNSSNYEMQKKATEAKLTDATHRLQQEQLTAEQFKVEHAKLIQELETAVCAKDDKYNGIVIQLRETQVHLSKLEAIHDSEMKRLADHVEELSVTVAKKEQFIQDLKAQSSEDKRQLSQQRGLLTASQLKAEQAQASARGSQRELVQLRTDLVSRQTEFEALAKRASEGQMVESKLSQECAELKKRITSFEVDLYLLNQKLQLKQDELTQAVNQCRQLQLQVQHQAESSEKIQQANSELLLSVGALQERIAQLKAEKDSCDKKLNQQSNLVQQFSSSIAEERAQIQRFKQELADSLQKQLQLSADLALKDQLLEQINSRLTRYESNTDLALIESEQQRDRLQAELKQQVNLCSDLASRLIEADSKLSELNSDMNSLSSLLTETQQQYQSCASALEREEEPKQEANRLHSMMGRLDTTADMLMVAAGEKIVADPDEIDVYRKIIEELMTENEGLISKSQTLEQTILEQSSDILCYRHTAQRLQDQLDESLNVLERLEQELEHRKNEIECLQSTVNELNRQVAFHDNHVCHDPTYDQSRSSTAPTRVPSLRDEVTPVDLSRISDRVDSHSDSESVRSWLSSTSLASRLMQSHLESSSVPQPGSQQSDVAAMRKLLKRLEKRMSNSDSVTSQLKQKANRLLGDIHANGAKGKSQL